MRTLFRFMGSVVQQLQLTARRCRQRTQKRYLWDYHFKTTYFFYQCDHFKLNLQKHIFWPLVGSVHYTLTHYKFCRVKGNSRVRVGASLQATPIKIVTMSHCWYRSHDFNYLQEPKLHWLDVNYYWLLGQNKITTLPYTNQVKTRHVLINKQSAKLQMLKQKDQNIQMQLFFKSLYKKSTPEYIACIALTS